MKPFIIHSLRVQECLRHNKLQRGEGKKGGEGRKRAVGMRKEEASLFEKKKVSHFFAVVYDYERIAEF